jgi:hypothetical protein
MEYGDVGVKNGILNISRHAFSCSMRFSSMEVEWALLWIPFIFFGTGIVVCSAMAWLEIRSAQALLVPNGRKLGSNMKESMDRLGGQRKRIFRIAEMTYACLLLNLVVTIMISKDLTAWTKALNVKVNCQLELDLLFISEDLVAAYKFEAGQSVCHRKDITISRRVCASDCYWRPDIDRSHTWCSGESESVESMRDRWSTVPCKCPCSNMILDEAEGPSQTVMTLSFVAQAMVVTLVGLNMGFRSHTPPCFKIVYPEVSASSASRTSPT